jgi:phenylalanyl-tRNA synthetase beta chain
MRTTALPSLAQALRRNILNRNSSALLYEIATVYFPRENELPLEQEVIVFGGYSKGMDFFLLKGQVEAILSSFRLTGATFKSCTDHESYHPGRCAMIELDGAYLGRFGQLHPNVAKNLDSSQPVYAAELNFNLLLEKASPEGQYVPLPKYPAVSRDLALVAKSEIPYAQVADAISKFSGKLLTECRLFDMYEGKNIPIGTKSMAFSLRFRANDRTLTDEEVDKQIAKLLKNLETELDIHIRTL